MKKRNNIFRPEERRNRKRVKVIGDVKINDMEKTFLALGKKVRIEENNGVRKK